MAAVAALARASASSPSSCISLSCWAVARFPFPFWIASSAARFSPPFPPSPSPLLSSCRPLSHSMDRPLANGPRFAPSSNLGLTAPSESFIPQIAILAAEIDVTEWKGDVLAVGVSSSDLGKDENGSFQNVKLRKLDEFLNGILGVVTTEEDFTGKAGQSTFVRLPGFGFKRVGLVGFEKSGVLSPGKWKGFGESVAAVAKTAQASSLAITLATVEDVDQESLLVTHAIASGVTLGLYEDVRFKSERKKPVLKSLDLLGFGSGTKLEEKLKNTEKICSGVIFTRELVNAPANVLTPAALAEEALSLSSSFKDVLTTQILDEEKCKELKMGSYLGVAAASTNPPKFIHVQYKSPDGDVKTKLAIVGKGLTFDSGGYNLKTGPGCSIDLMKFDMGGAAAALGAAKAIAAIRPVGVEVNFIIAACENMISGGGMRPGDILTASNGKTIEVNNTDAEGRLTLADALVYAGKQGVHKIVDLATLTGACVVALGTEIGGLFTPSDDLASELKEACERGGEKLWRMPMEDNYWEMMKSGIADMVNTGGRAGGSITASLFLKQFVDENIQWAHLDIAGPVWNEKKKGATGFAVSTLVEWVLKHAS